MLGKSGGDSSATNVNPHLNVDNASDTKDFFSPLVEESELVLVRDNFNDETTKSEEYKRNPERCDRSMNPRRPIERSVSDVVVVNRTKNRDSIPSSTQTAVHFQEEESVEAETTHSQFQGSPEPLRPSAQRSSSSSQVELRSRYHDLAISSASLQQQLVDQTRPISILPSRSGRVRRFPTVNVGHGVNTSSEETGPKWFSTVRSNTDIDLPMFLLKPKRHDPSTPLKPCIKKKAKSATTTPPIEGLEGTIGAAETRALRRVKTVDFDENGSKSLLASAPMAVASQQIGEITTNQPGKSQAQGSRSKRVIHRAPSCPGIMSTAKSSLADPAVTRTDVHVIAIAPSWSIDEAERGVDPATPTMQIIESKNGCYEVIWDDVPTEHSIRARRHSSSASHALETVSSTAIRGLERVNTKLTDWSGTWNIPSESFKPTIVVFPDDDGRVPQYDCAVEDDEDLVVLAPPNSQRTSGAPSRHHSRPTSAPITRAASQEEISLDTVLKETLLLDAPGWAFAADQSLVVPDPEGQPGRLASRRMSLPVAARKLSNVEDADFRFLGHRDSVTIAHSRLVHSGGISPDLFAHRDSVSLAKKRMHARNHATSAAQAISVDKEDSKVIDVDDVSVVSLPTVKEYAAQALKNSTSTSILRREQQPPVQRHIRIVE